MKLEFRARNTELLRSLFMKEEHIVIHLTEQFIILSCEKNEIIKMAYLPLLYFDGTAKEEVSFAIEAGLVECLGEEDNIQFEIDENRLRVVIRDAKGTVLMTFSSLLQATAVISMQPVINQIEEAIAYPKINLFPLLPLARVTRISNKALTISDGRVYTEYLEYNIFMKTDLPDFSIFSKPLISLLTALPPNVRASADDYAIYNAKNQFYLVCKNTAVIVRQALPTLRDSRALFAKQKYKSKHTIELSSLYRFRLDDKELEKVEVSLSSNMIRLQYAKYTKAFPIKIQSVMKEENIFNLPDIHLPVEMLFKLLMPLKIKEITIHLKKNIFACQASDYTIIGGYRGKESS